MDDNVDAVEQRTRREPTALVYEQLQTTDLRTMCRLVNAQSRLVEVS